MVILPFGFEQVIKKKKVHFTLDYSIKQLNIKCKNDNLFFYSFDAIQSG